MTSSYTNVPFDLADTEDKVILLNRFANDDLTLQVETGGTVSLEGTLAQINRGDTPTWATVNDNGGTPITAQGPGLVSIEDTPLEAVRVTSTGASTGRVMQQGG